MGAALVALLLVVLLALPADAQELRPEMDEAPPPVILLTPHGQLAVTPPLWKRAAKKILPYVPTAATILYEILWRKR